MHAAVLTIHLLLALALILVVLLQRSEGGGGVENDLCEFHLAFFARFPGGAETVRHAAVSASPTISGSADVSRIDVQPERPHAPEAGTNVAASVPTKVAWCSNGSFTVARI